MAAISLGIQPIFRQTQIHQKILIYSLKWWLTYMICSHQYHIRVSEKMQRKCGQSLLNNQFRNVQL